MPVPSNQVRHKWVPRGLKKGGMFPNSTSIDSDADVLIDVADSIVYGDAWVPRPAEIAFVTNDLNYTFPNYVTSMIVANFYQGSIPVSVLVIGNVGGLVTTYDGTTRSSVFLGTANKRFVFSHVKNRTYCCNGTDTPFIIGGAHPTAYPSTTGYSWGGSAQASTLTYSLTTNNLTAGSLSSVTNSGTAVVGSGTSFTSAQPGNPIYILGARYQIASITDNTHLSLTTPYAGTTGSVSNGSWLIGLGTMSWDPSGNTPGQFQYAVSYFDPITGHSTNLSQPILVNDGPPNADGIASISVNNIVMTNDPRFTKIIVWRTVHGGAQFFPRTILSNGGPGITSFADSDNVDTHLGVTAFVGTGNPGTVQGPQNSNFPPPSDLNYTFYWDGRFWGASTSQTGLVFFSARNDFSVQEISMGVGEECWPAVNTLPIPDSDGSMTGGRVVGGLPFITTEKGIYTITGNSYNTYRLVRVTTKGNGANHFALATLPGEDTNSSDILVHVGNDRRIYYLYGPGGDVAYSYPIQPRLSPKGILPPVLQNGTMGILHNSQGVYLLWSDGSLLLGGTSIFTYAFDVERQIWFEWSLQQAGSNSGVTAMCEGLFNGVNRFFVAGSKGIFYLQENPSSSQITWTNTIGFTSQRIAPPGVPRELDKMLHSFHIYDELNAFNGAYSVTVTTDFQSPASLVNAASFSPYPISQIVEPGELTFIQTNSPGTPQLLQSRTFQFQVIPPPNVDYRISAMEAIWSVTSTDGKEGLE